MTESEARKILAVLKAVYPRQQLTEATLRVYGTMLADLDADAVGAAVRRLICSSKFFPTVAEIRAELAESECRGLPPAELAWGEVQRAIGRWGVYGSPQWSCPELAAAVEAIGWRTICTDENTMSTRARFIDAYRVTRAQRRQTHQLGAHAAPSKRLGGQTALGSLKALSGGKNG